MKGTTILKAIDETQSNFPNFSSTAIILYDTKDRKVEQEDVVFANNLFAENTDEGQRFINFLTKLEKEPVFEMKVKITEHHVILFPYTPQARIFSRKITLSPLDCE